MEGEEEKEKEGGEGAMCVRVAAKRGGVYLAMREVATGDGAALLLHVGLAEVGALLQCCVWTRGGSWRRRDGEDSEER